MARIGAFLFLAVGILSTSANGYGLPGKQLVSKIIDKANSIVGKQKQTDVSLDLPENAYPVENVPISFTCRGDGLYTYPDDCTLGVLCRRGLYTLFTCTDVLHFNNVTKECDSFCSARCDPMLACVCGWDSCHAPEETSVREETETASEVTSVREDTETGELTKNKLKAPINCITDGYIPDPDDCNKFYDCSNGELIFMKCFCGLHFNKETGRCERPCDAGCDQTLSCNGKSDGTSTEMAPTEDNESDDQDEDKPRISFTCPRDGLFASREHCNQYFQCSRGRLAFRTCPPGLHFNKKEQRCDRPCKAKCDPNISCRQETRQTPETPDASEVTTSDSSKSSKKVFKLKLKFVCFDDGLFPDPKDCSKYINCSSGVSYELSCPPSKHFNSQTEKCESPCSAKCDPNLICKWRQFKNQFQEEFTNTATDDLCAKDGVYGNPLECEMYFRCENGHINAFQCSNGQHFNKETLRCEEPCDAHCDLSIAEKCGWDSTTESELENIIKESPKELCSNAGVYLERNPLDCETYFRCEDGDANLLQCPNGQHFSQETLQCEEPCNAHCDVSMESIIKESPKELCLKTGVYLERNPYDCETYFKCEDGDAHLLQCSNGQHFNKETLQCGEPCDARCDLSVVEKCGWEHENVLSNSLKQPTSEFQCRENGIYAHINCENFIQCTNGQAYLMNCPNGEHFDVWLKSCTTPCLARCAPNYEDFCEEEAKILSISLKQPTSEFQCRENGIYAHIACENFIQCTDGQAYLMNCPNGEHYDVWLKSCTTPCLARCAPNYEDFCEEEAKNRSPKQLLKDFDCVTDGYHANPLDCGGFIQCFRGEAYAISCPADLHYSHTLEICMSPCEAKCAPNYEEYCRAEERDKRRKLQRPRNNSVKQPFPLVTKFTCGVHPSDDGVYANPENCNSYIQCIVGESFIKLCPLGLHFSEKTKTCESPCEAQCDSSIGAYCGWDEYLTPTETTEESTFDYEMFLAASPRSLMYFFTCMKDGVYRNPDDCSTFIQCSGGHSYLMACPPGLHFSEELKKCYYKCAAWCDATLACECGWVSCFDYQKTSQEVDCEAEPDEGHCNGRIPRYAYDVSSGRCRGFHYGGCGGNSNNFKTMEECENKCQKKLLGGFRCPEDSGMFGHFPDCMSYYHCKRGVPTLKRCPKGTAFDHKRSKCVTEYEATCVYECRHKDAVYPYEEDCHKYIDCVNGISKLEKCPAGKAFDPEEKDCVDEKQVKSCFWASESKH